MSAVPNEPVAKEVLRVLVVEDDDEDFMLTRDLLAEVEEREYVVDWASTYADGLDAMSRREHDVYLLDYELDQRSGVDLVRAAFADGRLAPLILLTGRAGGQPDIEALEAGADAYLVKGQIDASALDRAIRYALVRRRFEAKVQDAQRLETLGVLASSIAHDFNNHLAGVLGNASLLVNALSTHPTECRTAEAIRNAGQRAGDLANQILAYAGGGRFIAQRLDLSQIATEMTALLGNSVSRTYGLYAMCDAPVMVEADETQLRQLLMNLISNAAEALRDGTRGTVILRTANVALDERGLGAYQYGNRLSAGRYALLEVSDDGCGMSEETRARIFDPFFTTKGDGRGLGMSAVLGIVRNHGGAIRVDSDDTGGTTVTILFPAVRAATPRAVPMPGDAKYQDQTGKHVLVVDDDASLCAVTKAMLELAGYNTLGAVSGEQALNVLRDPQRRVDLVLLDLVMPGLSGADTLGLLRATRPDLPVVISSGCTEAEMRTQLGGARVGLLQKPYTDEALVDAIERTLSESSRTAA